MISMEAAMNAVDLVLTGGAVYLVGNCTHANCWFPDSLALQLLEVEKVRSFVSLRFRNELG